MEKILNKKILVIDDDPLNIKMLDVFLKKIGLDVKACENGHDALLLIKENKYDLVITDIQMPGIDGYQVINNIRNWEKNNDKSPMVIWVSTASANEADIEKIKASGCDDYILKPIVKDNLYFKINSYFNQENTKTSFNENKTKLKNESSYQVEKLLNIFDGDRTFMLESIELLLEYIDTYFDSIKIAFDSSDNKKLQIAAHTFKGAVSNFHFQEAVALAQTLEDEARLGEGLNLIEEVEKLGVVVNEIKEFLISTLNRERAA